MSELIGIFGPSGQGKSTAVRTLDPTETFIINVTGKSLPFPGWKRHYQQKKGGNYYATEDHSTINQILTGTPQGGDGLIGRESIKNIVIDDFQYLMSFELMNRAQEKGWDKFTQMAQHAFSVLNNARKMREDQKIFILCHTAEKEDGTEGMKTVGKMLDEKIVPEGLFTIVLFTHVDNQEDDPSKKYFFQTQTNGKRTAKSPMGMFDQYLIPNDLQYVADRIDEYYHGEPATVEA